MTDLNKTPWLHVRGQFTYHAEATIRGTAEGLAALRQAIDDALREGRGEAEVFATDGEGYGITVDRMRTVASLGKPQYLDEIGRQLAEAERAHLVRYSKQYRAQQKEALAALRWCRANGDPHKAPAEDKAP